MLTPTQLTRTDGGLKWEYFQKNNYSCGYYCAKVLINTLGNGKDLNIVAPLRLTTDGVRQTDLIKVIRSKGVSASIYRNLDLKGIVKFILQGKYIIVYNHRADHWLLVTGVMGSIIEFYDSCNMWYKLEYDFVKEKLNRFGIVCGKTK